MAAISSRVAVKGSQRAPFSGSDPVGPAPKDERFEVMVRVRRKAGLEASAASGFHAVQTPKMRRCLTLEKNWTDQAKSSFDQALQSAAAMGVTGCCVAAMRDRVTKTQGLRLELSQMDWHKSTSLVQAHLRFAAEARN
jgi:hypothetical protein